MKYFGYLAYKWLVRFLSSWKAPVGFFGLSQISSPLSPRNKAPDYVAETNISRLAKLAKLYSVTTTLHVCLQPKRGWLHVIINLTTFWGRLLHHQPQCRLSRMGYFDCS